MLTARERVEDRIRGLREGADDYLGKPFSFLELVARLQALTRRSGGHEPVQVTVADLWIDLISRKASRNGLRLDLTAKEFSLLSVLARRQGEILSKTAIAEMVWDINFDSDANVVVRSARCASQVVGAVSSAPAAGGVQGDPGWVRLTIPAATGKR